MKILLVSPYLPARDGIAAYSGRLVETLRARGHEVHVVTPRPHGDAPDIVMGSLGSWAAPEDLRSRIAEWAPDIVHVQFGVGAFGSRTVSLLRWLHGARVAGSGPGVVLTMHEVTRDTALLRGAGRRLYRWLADRADHVIVHTEASRAALIDIADGVAAEVTVVPHPSTPPPPARRSTSELRSAFDLGTDRYLLAFGFIHVDKGLGDLVAAFARVRAAGVASDVRLVVAGTVRPRRGAFRIFEAWDRVHLARVRFAMRRLGLMPHVLCTGYVPDSDVQAWFLGAEAVVLPYRRIEESGVACIAAAMQTPMVCSRVGGLAEAVRESRWTFPARERGALAHVLTDLLSTPPLERCGAVPAVGKIPATEVTSRTVDCYHAALGTRRSKDRSVHA